MPPPPRQRSSVGHPSSPPRTLKALLRSLLEVFRKVVLGVSPSTSAVQTCPAPQAWERTWRCSAEAKHGWREAGQPGQSDLIRLGGPVPFAVHCEASAWLRGDTTIEYDQLRPQAKNMWDLRPFFFVFDTCEEQLPPLLTLLEERGVDYGRPNVDRDVQLPLEAFEDTTMWTRTPEEWQQLMWDESRRLGTFKGRQEGFGGTVFLEESPKMLVVL